MISHQDEIHQFELKLLFSLHSSVSCGQSLDVAPQTSGKLLCPLFLHNNAVAAPSTSPLAVTGTLQACVQVLFQGDNELQPTPLALPLRLAGAEL